MQRRIVAMHRAHCHEQLMAELQILSHSLASDKQPRDDRQIRARAHTARVGRVARASRVAFGPRSPSRHARYAEQKSLGATDAARHRLLGTLVASSPRRHGSRANANTWPSCSARGSERVSSGVPDHWCEPGTKRVAPLSGRNSSTIRMKPSSGQSAESRRTSTCRSPAGTCGRSVRACSELSLNGRPMTRQQASSKGGNT